MIKTKQKIGAVTLFYEPGKLQKFRIRYCDTRNGGENVRLTLRYASNLAEAVADTENHNRYLRGEIDCRPDKIKLPKPKLINDKSVRIREEWMDRARKQFAALPKFPSPCYVCKTTDSICNHHLIPLQKQFKLGFRTPDQRTIPLCANCHSLVHKVISEKLFKCDPLIQKIADAASVYRRF